MDSARSRHVRKGSVAVVMVKNALRVAGDEDVLVAVTVIIPNRHSHGEEVGRDAGLLGDVRESPVSIVAVESMTVGSRRVKEHALACVHEQQVHVPVIVVIKDRDPGRFGLRQVVLRRHRVVMDPHHAGLPWIGLPECHYAVRAFPACR